MCFQSRKTCGTFFEKRVPQTIQKTFNTSPSSGFFVKKPELGSMLKILGKGLGETLLIRRVSPVLFLS
jgi:hypothetical protein